MLLVVKNLQAHENVRKVQVLKVKHVLVCGHTNCGAVKAALTLPASSNLLCNCWINQIRDLRNWYVDELVKLSLPDQVARLAELNVVRQVFNVCTSPVVQQMWENKFEVHVHGLLYSVQDGSLKRLVGPISGNAQVPEQNEEKFDANLEVRSLADVLSHFPKAYGLAQSRMSDLFASGRASGEESSLAPSDGQGNCAKRPPRAREEKGAEVAEDEMRSSDGGFHGDPKAIAANDAALRAMIHRLDYSDDMDNHVHEKMRVFTVFERQTSHS